MSSLTQDQDTLVEYCESGSIMLITLNRPQTLNALTVAMLDRLGELFRAADADPAVRVIVMTGAGRAFCSGADVGGLQDAANTPIAKQMGPMPTFTARQCKIFKPTICAVNGVCAGAGLHFVADCDIVIGSESASFVDSHVNVGQVTSLEPIGLSRRIPLGAVLRMVLLGKAERLNAQQALTAGLISEVLPPERLLDRALELARIVCAGSPAAIRASLEAIWESYEMPLSVAYEKGYKAVVQHRAHPDASEGPQAFLEKRAPQWRD